MKHYVIALRERSSYRLLIGPYDSIEHAELMVETGRQLAIAADPSCINDTFSAGSITPTKAGYYPTGIFGKI